MPTRITSEEFKQIYAKVPRVCVDLFIKNNKGEVLLTYRKIYPKDIWHLPGSTVCIDETLEEAAHRTAKEELDAEIKIIGLKKYLDHIGKFSKEYGRPISFVFEAELITQTKDIKLDFQASKWGFFKELPEKMDLGHKEFLLSLKD